MDDSKVNAAIAEMSAENGYETPGASNEDVEKGSTGSPAQSQIICTQRDSDEDSQHDGLAPMSSNDAPPDGGRDAWLMLLGGWCGVFCTLGLLNCGGVFEAYYTIGPLRSYGASNSSWIISVQPWALNFSGLVFGRLYDRYGPRWIVLIGSLFFVFGLMMLSLGTQYWQFFLAQSICVGVAGGAIFNSCIATVVTWFEAKRATAYGIMLSGAGIGGVIVPIVLTRMIDEVGFPWAVRTVAFLYLLLLTISVLTVKARTPPTPRKFSIKDYLEGFKQPAYVLLVVASFCYYWGMFLPLNYIILQAKAAGVNPELVSYLVPMINAMSVIGRVGPGLIADRVGRFNTAIVITALSAVFTLALWIPGRSQAAIVLYALLFGASSGGFISLQPALIAHVSDLRQMGSRTGAVYAVQSFATLTGSPIAGSIISAMHGRYLGLELFCGLAMASSALALAASRVVLAGPGLKTKV